MTKPHPTSIRLTEETKRRLKKFADAKRWSLNQLIQYVLEEWLKFQERGKK